MAVGSDYITISGVMAYWTPYISGAFTTEEPFGEIDELSMAITEEDLQHISRACGSVGIADKIAISKTEILLDILSPEISPNMLARAFRGILTENAVTAGTATEDDVTVTLLDTAYNLSKRHVMNLEAWTLTGKSGSQWVEGTDYTINYDKGTFTALSTGGISALDHVFVTFDNVAYNDWSIAGFLGDTATGKLRIEACAVEGMDVEYTFEKVSLKMNGSYSLISAEEFATVPLQGTALADTTITDSTKSQVINIVGDDLFDV